MPPPKIEQEADRRAEGDAASAGSPTGPSISRTGRSSRRSGPQLPAVKNAGWVRNPIDRFVLAELEKHGLAPGPRGRPPDAGPPAQPRPDRPAAGAGGRRGVRQRPGARRLREATSIGCWRRRTGASIAAATGSTPPATPTRTASTSTTTARSGPIATGSSAPSTATCRSTSSRSSSWPATCCPNRTLDQQVASGFNRCNITTNEGGVIAEEYLVLYTRDRTETIVAGLAGPDGRLRGLPRPQVRPAQRRESSTSCRRSSTTRRRPRWTATSRTRRRSSSCRRPEDRPRWDALAKELAEARKQVDGPQASRPRRLRQVAGRGDAGRHGAAGIPTRRAAAARPAQRGRRATTRQPDGGRQAARGDAGGGRRLGRRARRREGVQERSPARPSELADVGDFEKDQGFSYGAWVKLPKDTSGRRRRRPHGRPARLPRLGPVDRERPRRRPHRQQVADGRPQGGLARTPSSRAQWNHVFVTYDGSGKAAGVQVYVNGEPQETTVEADQLQEHDPHDGAAQGRPAAQHVPARRPGDAGPADLRPRAVGRGSRPAWRRRPGPPGWPTKPADQRTRGGEERAVRLVAADAWTRRIEALPSKLSDAAAGGSGDQGARHGRPRHAGAARAEPMAYVLFRGEYDKRRDQVKPDTPSALPPMPADLPRNRLGFAAVAAAAGAPADGARHGQPLLAGGLRHRPRAHDRRLRRHRRAAVASRAARLAGGRVPRVGLGREAVLPADGHVGDLPAVGRDHAGEAARRTRRTGCCRAGRGSAWTPR